MVFHFIFSFFILSPFVYSSTQDVLVRSEAIQGPRSEITSFSLSGEEVSSLGVQTFGELLNFLPGVVSLSNGLGAAQPSVYGRGLPSDAVQVFIDGVPVNDPSTIGSQLNGIFLLPTLIEEISYRPSLQSDLQTIGTGGVIHIKTKKAMKTDSLSVLSRFAPYSTLIQSQGAATDGAHAHSLSLSQQRTGGFSAARPSGGNSFENDSSESVQLRYQYEYALSDDSYIDTQLFFTETDFDLDSFSSTDSLIAQGEVDHLLATSAYNWQSEQQSIKASIGLNYFDRYYLTDFSENNYKGQLLRPELHYSRWWKKVRVDFFLEGRFTEFESKDLGTGSMQIGEENGYGVGSKLGLRLLPSMLVSGQFRHVEFDEQQATQQAQLSLEFSEEGSIWKHAFFYRNAEQRPSLVERFGAFGPNPLLQNEEIESYGTETRYAFPIGELKASLFRQHLFNPIFYQGQTGPYINGESYSNWGEEVNVKLDVGAQAKLFASATHLHLPGPPTEALRAAEWSGKAFLRHRIGNKGYAQAEYLWIGERLDSAISGTRRLQSNQTVNLSWMKQWDGASLRLSWLNVFDEQRPELAGYTRLGQQWLIQVQMFR